MKNRIIQVRRNLGLTQKEFGLNLGCSRDKISNIELGRVIPDDVFIKHICVVYKVSESWMMTGQGEMWSGTGSNELDVVNSYGELTPAIRCFIDTISRLPERDKAVLENFLINLSETIQNEIK